MSQGSRKLQTIAISSADSHRILLLHIARVVAEFEKSFFSQFSESFFKFRVLQESKMPPQSSAPARTTKIAYADHTRQQTRKPHRYRPSENAIREIRKYQSYTKQLIRKRATILATKDVDTTERERWIHYIYEITCMLLRPSSADEEKSLRNVACECERMVYCKAKSFEQYKCMIRTKISNALVKGSFDGMLQPRCVVCMDRNSTHIVVPCGHHCICALCSSKMKANHEQRCPICRQTFVSIIKVFAA